MGDAYDPYSFPETDVRTVDLFKGAFVARHSIPRVVVVNPTRSVIFKYFIVLWAFQILIWKFVNAVLTLLSGSKQHHSSSARPSVFEIVPRSLLVKVIAPH